MNSKRFCLVIVVLLYGAALAAPVRQITAASPVMGRIVEVIPGWRVLELGWVGLLGLAFGWYANIFLAVAAVRLARGRSPGCLVPRVGNILAASSLLPYAQYSEVDGLHRGYLRGPGVWLWLAAFVAVLVEAEWHSGLIARKASTASDVAEG